MRSLYATGAPPMLRVAAVVQALEAAGLCVVAVAQVVETASGRSYQASNGTGLAVMEFITAALFAWIASAIARVRPWSRTPAIMTQLGCGLLAIILLQASRLDWGLPILILAIVGLVGLFSPASFKALARPREAESHEQPRTGNGGSRGAASNQGGNGGTARRSERQRAGLQAASNSGAKTKAARRSGR